MLNETISYNLLQAHQTTAIPAILILYIFSLIITLIVGLSIVKHSREKYMLIWVISAVFMGLVVLMLCLMPSFTQSMIKFINILK
jgi:hypothetical protein